MSPRGLVTLTKWVQLWADKKLDPAFTEPWLQAKVSILQAHTSRVRRATGSHQRGIYHEGGALEIAWKIHTKMAAEPKKAHIACDIKNGFGAARWGGAVEGARRWYPGLGQIFANLWAGKEEVHQTAWASTQRGSGPIPVRDGFLQGACEAPVAFALALRVALTEFDDEIRKQGVQFTTELEYCAYVGDINGRAGTVCHDETQRDAWSSEATTHSLLQTPEITATIREKMTQFVKWTPSGLMIWGTASDRDYRTEITAATRKSHEPTSDRLQKKARILADKIRQMCEADLECRRLP